MNFFPHETKVIFIPVPVFIFGFHGPFSRKQFLIFFRQMFAARTLSIFRSCLYGRRDGTFFSPGLRENVSTWDNLQSQHNIVPAKRDGVFMIKNCPALAGIPVERTGIPFCRDGTKNVPEKLFPYKRNGTNKRYIHVWRDPVSHINSPLFCSSHAVVNCRDNRSVPQKV